MYKAEVLGKLPIMQHFLFGSVVAFEGEGGVGAGGDDDGCCGNGGDHKGEGEGHVHAFGQEFPDCCGIRVPSAIAAAVAKGGLEGGVRPRPLPFD